MEVEVKILPGGKSRIHWFIRDPAGPIRTRGKRHRLPKGPAVALGGACGKIACQPALASVAPQMQGGVIRVLKHSDDFRAVTCPECIASEEYQRLKAQEEG